ncbi:uncharacterized protein BP01DRAFT_188616 [Aspergillus saccharolyticus JOP 1030-1]|uniref:Secreted protein n=1 Tax=Aspergillus saccharolyticus JOP 1030-1 TaxID=1450539 RepID=A0A318Z1V0_9EURO|nr:hypothetical protein BP01DRAFT_188616 [Aspergillus saccharolyticus JOP 1030-1]PYH41016.1 hypothetical protein BP01DRAFT_188616 [Aspergillus saccharolyticus JOP 1030-1]
MCASFSNVMEASWLLVVSLTLLKCCRRRAPHPLAHLDPGCSRVLLLRPADPRRQKACTSRMPSSTTSSEVSRRESVCSAQYGT